MDRAIRSEEQRQLYYLRYFLHNRCAFSLAIRTFVKLWTFMSPPWFEKTIRTRQKGWHRRYPRYRADFPLTATALSEGGYFESQGRCGDIAHAGLGAVLTSNAQPGDVLALKFQLPNASEPLSIRAIVRYRNGFVHGLEFLGLTPEQQTVIDEFCASLFADGLSE
jgi:PilZ domain